MYAIRSYYESIREPMRFQPVEHCKSPISVAICFGITVRGMILKHSKMSATCNPKLTIIFSMNKNV